MRHVGQTDNGEHLVQFSREEWQAISELMMAVQGKTEWAVRGWAQADMRSLAEHTMETMPVFLSVMTFAQAKFRVNELREFADELDRLLEGKAASR